MSGEKNVLASAAVGENVLCGEMCILSSSKTLYIAGRELGRNVMVLLYYILKMVIGSYFGSDVIGS